MDIEQIVAAAAEATYRVEEAQRQKSKEEEQQKALYIDTTTSSAPSNPPSFTSDASALSTPAHLEANRLSRASGDSASQHATSTCAHCGRENAASATEAREAESAAYHSLIGLPSQEAKLLWRRQAADDLARQNAHSSVADEEPNISEWIYCDLCRKWFHCICVDVQEYEVPLIDKFHCPSCRFEHGDSIMKVQRLSHRYAFDDESERDLPDQIGTEQWTRRFREQYKNIPEAPSPSVIQFYENGAELMAAFDFTRDWTQPIKVLYPRGLGLRMPDDPYFDVLDVIKLLSETVTVDTIDVYAQRSYTMSLGRFYGLWRKRVRNRLYNILSLEFSGTKLCDIVRSPSLVRSLSWVQKFWPDSDHFIGGKQQSSEETDERQASSTDDPYAFNDTTEASAKSKAHESSRPFVELFCLMGMHGSYTDFHIDFGGSSVWYHVFKGEKVFFLARPSPENLAEFLRWQNLDVRKHSETFFGDCLPPGEQLYRLHVYEGETLFLPSGWIHSVFTPEDSLVFGGNFLHSLNVPMQMRIYEMELEANIDDRFKFPYFELCNFYAAKNMAETLKDHTAEATVADQFQLEAARALLAKCSEWLKHPSDKFAIFSGNLKQLERELARQRHLKRRISEKALTAATAFNDSTSSSISGSPCSVGPQTMDDGEAIKTPNLDAHDLFDRTFALEDEEEDEEFEEDALWNRTSSTEDDHELKSKKSRPNKIVVKKHRDDLAKQKQNDEMEQATILEIESAGPVKLKIKLPCWKTQDGTSASTSSQQFGIKRVVQRKPKKIVITEDDERSTLDVGKMFSGRSTHGRQLKPSTRISDSGTSLEATDFVSDSPAMPISCKSVPECGSGHDEDADFAESAKKRPKKSFLAQFTPEERRQIEIADRAGELDSCGQLFSPFAEKHLKSSSKPKPKKKTQHPQQHIEDTLNTSSCPDNEVSSSMTPPPKKPRMSSRERLAKKLGLMRKK